MDRRTAKQIEEIFLCYLLLMPKRKQTVAANKLGIRRQYFNNYYNGLYRPPDELLFVMEDFLFVHGVQLKTIKNLRHFSQELTYVQKEKQVRLAPTKYVDTQKAFTLMKQHPEFKQLKYPLQTQFRKILSDIFVAASG